MIHGGRDASATFQFLVDAFVGERRVLAPDLRGHGRSDPAPGGYWFLDYLADLDALLSALVGAEPVAIVGHSLGGNLACQFAGVRPARVSRLVSLDGFGLPDRDAAEAPDQIARWLDAGQVRDPPRVHPDRDAMAARLVAANPRLDAARALFLAENLSRPVPGGFAWAFDPAHRLPFPTLHRRAEWEATIRRITAPALWIGSETTFPPSLDREPGGLAGRAALAGADLRRVAGTGHNLHHDRPDAVAALIEAFLDGG